MRRTNCTVRYRAALYRDCGPAPTLYYAEPRCRPCFLCDHPRAAVPLLRCAREDSAVRPCHGPPREQRGGCDMPGGDGDVDPSASGLLRAHQAMLSADIVQGMLSQSPAAASNPNVLACQTMESRGDWVGVKNLVADAAKDEALLCSFAANATSIMYPSKSFPSSFATHAFSYGCFSHMVFPFRGQFSIRSSHSADTTKKNK